MRTTYPVFVLVLGTLLGGAFAAGQESPETKEVLRTDRTLSTAFGGAQWARISDGFVLHINSDRQITELKQRRAKYDKRRGEYLALKNSLNEQLASVQDKLPDTRYVSMSQSLFRRYDSNQDEVIDNEERKQIRSNLDNVDSNNDDKISRAELTSWLMSRMGRGTKDAKPPENLEELFAQHESLETELKQLAETFDDVGVAWKQHTYYRVIEVAGEYVRLRNDNEERIIPYSSIREIRRPLDE